MSTFETWELWYPNAAANGLMFARARIDPTQVLWAHAAPPTLTVVVRNDEDEPVARSEALERKGGQLPMTRLTRESTRVEREDRWPTDADLGAPVLLPGGEVGLLLRWWNAPDESEWRWQVEFYNHR
jgi:hypothetical protein